jgi:hypothetical protein
LAISQVQEDGFDIEQGTADPMTWSKGSAFVVTWIPAWDHDELSASTIWVTAMVPLA